MKVIQLTRFGGPEVLQLAQLPTPVPGPGQILVRVRAAGVNFAETLMREDRYAMTPPLPSVPGVEAAGEIVAIGPDVSGFDLGARVAAPLFAAGLHSGGYADHVVIPAELVVLLPDDLSFEDATALMIQGLTAAYLLKQASPAGKTILVNAAAGGVGSILVQLARKAGAKTIVAAAGSDDKLAFARSLGADIGIDYTQPDWTETMSAALDGEGPDIIYESVGGAITMASLAALAPLGRIIVYGALNIQQFALGVPDLLGLIFKNQSLTGFALAPLLTPASLRAELGGLFELAARGELRVTIGGSYPLERVGEAHQALEQRATMGKLVLLP
ncbi:MAG: zinc-binding dehydrogenase [Sphingomonas sp.]|jgi:NADPH2:quinone reductase|uniref:quinone oxidoreductase family protein n=1 Tax=Sphingomonas sp. TaxID=28214 RepID=UPI003568CE29